MLNFCIVLCTNDQANQYTVDAIFFLNNEDSIVGFLYLNILLKQQQQ